MAAMGFPDTHLVITDNETEVPVESMSFSIE